MEHWKAWVACGAILVATEAYGEKMQPGAGPAPEHPGLERGTEVNQPASTARLAMYNNVRGRVTAIDRANHVLMMETAQYGDLRIAFQPNDIEALNAGEYVTVELGIWPGSLQEDPLRAGDQPVEPKVAKNDRAMTGTVTSIDHKTGVLGVSTEERGELRLAFPIDAIKDFKPNDRVTVQMAFNKADAAPGEYPNRD